MKAVSDVYAPLSGEIVAVNDAVAEQPGADQRGPLRRGVAGAREALRPVRGRASCWTPRRYRKLLAEED